MENKYQLKIFEVKSWKWACNEDDVAYKEYNSDIVTAYTANKALKAIRKIRSNVMGNPRLLGLA